MVALLHVHPSRSADLRAPDELRAEPAIAHRHLHRQLWESLHAVSCAEGSAPSDQLHSDLRFRLARCRQPGAREVPVQELPHDVLRYLFNSRYCEVDRFSTIALELFGAVPPGWSRVQAVCDWVHSRVAFGYHFARPTKTASGRFHRTRRSLPRFPASGGYPVPRAEYSGALCDRISGRYRRAASPTPMDFSAWFEAYLEDRWWTFDARHNHPRIGRVLMATGRDASDVAITTSFGMADLAAFHRRHGASAGRYVAELIRGLCQKNEARADARASIQPPT